MSSEKYSRQILLKEIGESGQKKLQSKKVGIIGVGALGSVAVSLLVRAGVENILIVDRDCIEESNLQRQILFTENDIGKSKVEVAKEKLQLINSNCKIEVAAISLASKNIEILQNVDLVLDCTDNLQTRFLINDFCKQEKIPWIYAAAIKTSGYVFPIFPEGPCLACFLQEASLETCDTVGVLNTITTIIAAKQTTLAMKILLEEKVDSILSHHDIWNNKDKQIKINTNPNCKTCLGEFSYLKQQENEIPIRFCSSGVYQIVGKEQNLNNFKEKLELLGKVICDEETLRFQNLTLFKDGRVLIKANSEGEALAAYSKFIGN